VDEWRGQWVDQTNDYAPKYRKVLRYPRSRRFNWRHSKLLDIELHFRWKATVIWIIRHRSPTEWVPLVMVNGLLILCKFLLAFTRLLPPVAPQPRTIPWANRWAGYLPQSNVKEIFDACQNNNFGCSGCFPNPESAYWPYWRIVWLDKARGNYKWLSLKWVLLLSVLNRPKGLVNALQ